MGRLHARPAPPLLTRLRRPGLHLPSLLSRAWGDVGCHFWVSGSGSCRVRPPPRPPAGCRLSGVTGGAHGHRLLSAAFPGTLLGAKTQVLSSHVAQAAWDLDHADWPGARTVGLWPFGCQQRPSSHPQPHLILQAGPLQAQGTSHLWSDPGSRLRPRAALQARKRPSSTPWPLRLCPAGLPLPRCSFWAWASRSGAPTPLAAAPAEPRRPEPSCRTALGQQLPLGL